MGPGLDNKFLPIHKKDPVCITINLADAPDYLDQRFLIIDTVRLVHVEFCLFGVAAVEFMSGLIVKNKTK